ncbi:cell division protein FtsQ/DivIB [Streptomyces orinoci]|uniref:Cell division protein FtsQ n=1 Tax=Streptomyces orinoci TaxID=67339 RepID=A0ABV3JX81_STRON|nr:FtsQ-type POTRA domain-containing protein [Streptomyces orinoci]
MAGPTTARRGGDKSRKPKPKSSAPGPSRPPKSAKGPRKPAAARGLGALRRRLTHGRRLILCGAAVALLGAGVTWALYGSGLLRATRVEVTGTTVLTPAEVRAAAAVPLGDPLISVDTDAVEARLRDRLPRVASVEASRSWPHTISLKVTERRPKAVLEKDGKFIEIDGMGVRFATVDRAPDRVPRLTLETSDEAATASNHRFGTQRLEREGVRVANDLPAAVRQDTVAVRVRSYDSITVELTGGRTVVWGSGERGEAKARTLTALMKAAPSAKHFNVSAPSAPAASGS